MADTEGFPAPVVQTDIKAILTARQWFETNWKKSECDTNKEERQSALYEKLCYQIELLIIAYRRRARYSAAKRTVSVNCIGVEEASVMADSLNEAMTACQLHQGQVMYHEISDDLHKLFHTTALSGLHVGWIVHPTTKGEREPDIVKPVYVSATHYGNLLYRAWKGRIVKLLQAVRMPGADDNSVKALATHQRELLSTLVYLYRGAFIDVMELRDLTVTYAALSHVLAWADKVLPLDLKDLSQVVKVVKDWSAVRGL